MIMKIWDVIKYVITWPEWRSKWSYLINFAMRWRAMILKPTPSGQPSARREVLFPWRSKFFEKMPASPQNTWMQIWFPAGVCGHNIDFVFFWFLCESESGMRTESSHLKQNPIKALAGLLFLYTCVWEKVSFRIVFRNYFLSLYIIFVSSTSLPGGNQVDGLPPVASSIWVR